MPAPDLSEKDDKELDQWIINHEREPGGTAKPRYLQLLEERARRTQAKQQLDFGRSLEHLKQTAIRQVCTTYGDLSKASGLEWSKARYQMNGSGGHLERLLELCHARGLPLLTAICVNQSSVLECELGEDALAGFAAGARRLGRDFTDNVAFHHKCREKCWEWGREQFAKTV
jgi:hypothetical protein